MNGHTILSSWFPQTQSNTCSRTSSLSLDWTMTLLNTWLLCGVLMDGWAHNHFGETIDSFFTPWHAVLYSGFLAVAAFHVWTAFRNYRKGCAWREVMPDGYGLSLIGIILFGISGIGDLLWHEIIGIEVSVAAGFSPPHLGIMIGIGLIVSGPLRAQWNRPLTAPRKWARWLPALLSMHMGLTLMSFVTQYAHPLVVLSATTPATHNETADVQNQALGAASILLQTALLMGWVLVTLRRWKLPLGSLTLVLSLNGIAMCVMRDTFILIPGIVLAGICGDILLWKLRPAPGRALQFHLFAFALPVTYFALYFATLLLVKHIEWPLPLWTGVTLMAGIASLLVSYLTLPPQRDDRAETAAVGEQKLMEKNAAQS